MWPPLHDQVEYTGWQDTIAAADLAIGEATRIQRGVQDNLKLHQQVRQLREELEKAYADLARYCQTHARAVTNLRQLERETTTQISTLQAQADSLLLRHRIYKLMTDHYALAALGLDRTTLVTHRNRVAQHVLFQKKKGIPVSEIGLGDVGLEILQ